MGSGVFLKNRRARNGGGTAIVVPGGSTAERPVAPVFGSFRFNTDLGLLEFFDGTLFQALTPVGEVDIVVDTFTGDGFTVTFSMSVNATDDEQILVFVGAIYQNPSSYSVTGDGNDITFSEAPPASETINVIHNVAKIGTS